MFSPLECVLPDLSFPPLIVSNAVSWNGLRRFQAAGGGGGVCWDFGVPNRFSIGMGYSTWPPGKKSEALQGFLGKTPGGCGFFWVFIDNSSKSKNPTPWSILLFPTRSRPITDENWVLRVGFFQVGFKASKIKNTTLWAFSRETPVLARG